MEDRTFWRSDSVEDEVKKRRGSDVPPLSPRTSEKSPRAGGRSFWRPEMDSATEDEIKKRPEPETLRPPVRQPSIEGAKDQKTLQRKGSKDTETHREIERQLDEAIHEEIDYDIVRKQTKTTLEDSPATSSAGSGAELDVVKKVRSLNDFICDLSRIPGAK